MGVLRSDRVSGLGGANAINGSVFFGGTTSDLRIDKNDEFQFASGSDFTIEAWVKGDNFPSIATIVAVWDQTGAASGDQWILCVNNSGTLQFAWSPETVADLWLTGGTLSTNTWYHVAISRTGDTFKLFLDGTQVATDTQSGTNASNSILQIGKYSAVVNSQWNGNISNLRIIKGEGIYTAAFTPPTTRLEKTSNTVLLCCQSPGDVTQEATGKIITPTNGGNSGNPKASRLAPDVGEDHGTTFADGAVLDTLSYMVPPGGKTTERYIKSTGDIVSGNLIWHIDAGNVGSYAGVTTSGTTIYDLKAGSGMNGTVGIATLASGHADFPAPGWTPDNGGAWYLSSDSNLASPSNTGQHIIMPYVNLGNDNYTINVWVKLQYYSEQSDGLSYLVTNKDGSPVSYHAHIKEVSGQGRIGGGAYYTGWTYDYASSDSENTMIALNKWYMLTWVNTAQYTQSMYVNGVIQKLNGGAYTWNSRSSNNTPVNATSYANNETTNGWIGQIQYYSDTLTADEILQNYNAHKCRYDQ